MAITTSIASPADVANNAMIRMGFRLRVGSLLDGSDHAQDVLNVYGQCRDELLSVFDYDFAERTLGLTQLKAAPAGGYFPPNAWNPVNHPPVGWGYEYEWPDSALKIRTIKPPPSFVLNMDPRNYPFTEYNDRNYTPAQRTILCNVGNAIAVYTGRITDPTTWSVQFADALAARLAVVLGPALVGLQASQITMAESSQADAQAMVEQR